MAEKKQVRITHKPSGEIIAEGPLGWGIMSFEGNYYIQSTRRPVCILSWRLYLLNCCDIFSFTPSGLLAT